MLESLVKLVRGLTLCTLLATLSCGGGGSSGGSSETAQPSQTVVRVDYDQAWVDVVVEKPANKDVDVLLAFHGTVVYDSLILQAAKDMLERVKKITARKDLLLVSVAYPEEGLLMGDNLRACEAALLWVKNRAGQDLGVNVRKIFLVGHSQGGYLVTRLNTLYRTDGIVANGPGPLNLVYRCGLEESDAIPVDGVACGQLRAAFGSVSTNPQAYWERSLLNFTGGQRSEALFVQGLQDSSIQMASWPTFKENLAACQDCATFRILELPGGGHGALFEDPTAMQAFNAFLSR